MAIMVGFDSLPDRNMSKLSDICELPKGWGADDVAPTKKRYVAKMNGKTYEIMEIGRRRCAEMNIEGASDDVVAEIGRKSILGDRTVIVRLNGEWKVRENFEGCPKFVMRGKSWRPVPVRKHRTTEQVIRDYEKPIDDDIPVRLKRRKGEKIEQYRQREADSLARMCAGVRCNKRVKDHIEKGEGCIITTKRFENSRLTCVCKTKKF